MKRILSKIPIIGEKNSPYNIQIVDLITNPISFTEYVVELKNFDEDVSVLRLAVSLRNARV
jgi:hypothetical protein